MMDQDNEDQDHRLDAIVGEALKLFVESCSDGYRIGMFAAQFRAKTAKILGQPAIRPEEPDLLDMIGQAVRQALLERELEITAAATIEAKKKH